jgi:hypothetical protein
MNLAQEILAGHSPEEFFERETLTRSKEQGPKVQDYSEADPQTNV